MVHGEPYRSFQLKKEVTHENDMDCCYDGCDDDHHRSSCSSN